MKFEKIERSDRQIPLILKLDKGGQPVKWIHWHDAVIMTCTDKVVWTLGEPIKLVGGTNAKTGEPSIFELSPILACNDQSMKRSMRVPTLTNRELFRRDHNICMYCGNEYPNSKLTRDHIHPVSRGGKNTWTNVVTACRGCNHLKADRTPEEAHMPLIAVPYAPNPAEFLILQNRRVIADQMDYLSSYLPDNSRAWKYVHA